MRLIVDSLVAIMLAGMLAGVVISSRQDSSEVATRDLVRNEVRRFQREIMLQRALGPTSLEETAFPETIDPAWFGEILPTNPLLPPAHPWLEVASGTQRVREHPPDRATSDPKVARFWYNPKFGVLRARVPPGVSDDETLELYNYVNGTRLKSLYDGAG